MKVLFAVSNDKMSESIVRQYQKEYKQIISYKNVYYFNAILKELQRDKGYERVVISEDLEQYTNSDYEQMDKFMFDKLDSITDEASNMNGEDIPIILICSERRTKSEPLLVKLFGIGIYNAIIGNDRSVNEVCRLINRPRSKKEAKSYYKIDSKDVKYTDDENENDVSELEIQNILSHYKRIADNEEKYVESFDSIASQYNDVQLRVISKCLPLKVRAVLEEKSTKYQEINSYNNKIADSTRIKQRDKNTGTSEQLLTNSKAKTLTEPVVVPSVIDTTKKRKILTRPINQSNTGVHLNTQETKKEIPEILQEEPFKTPSIPDVNSKQIFEKPEISEIELEEISNISNEVEIEQLEQIPQQLQQEEVTEKRKRGRPRKIVEEPVVQTPKRKRGRPRKVTEQSEENNVLPGLSYNNEEPEILPGLIDDSEEEQPNLVDNTDNILPGLMDDSVEELLPGLESNVEEEILPGLMDNSEYDDSIIPGLIEDDIEEAILPGITTNDISNNTPSSEFENDNNIEEHYTNILQSLKNENDKEEYKNISLKQDEIKYGEIDLNALMNPNQKLIAFLGTSKNGTSFLINNVAELLSANGIDTAILDLTHNRNAYYIYTKNEDTLREQSNYIIKNLIEGEAKGIEEHKNLTIYTSLFENDEDLKNVEPIIETLVKKHTVVLMDCDFTTPMRYFKYAQEIYLVQSMDILTIQPLTAFLRQLSDKEMLEESKIRVILNKFIKTKEINEEILIGGISIYNDAGMTVRKELFNRKTVPYTTIPFELKTYLRYLDGLVICDVSLKGYSKEFIQSLKKLANMVYQSNNANMKGKYTPPSIKNSSGFTPSMNNTLNQMKQNY